MKGEHALWKVWVFEGFVACSGEASDDQVLEGFRLVPVPAVQTGSAKKRAESEWCKNEQCKWIVRRQGQGRTDVVVVVVEEEEEEEQK